MRKLENWNNIPKYKFINYKAGWVTLKCTLQKTTTRLGIAKSGTWVYVNIFKTLIIANMQTKVQENFSKVTTRRKQDSRCFYLGPVLQCEEGPWISCSGPMPSIILQLTLEWLFHDFSGETSELQMVNVYAHRRQRNLRLVNCITYFRMDFNKTTNSALCQWHWRRSLTSANTFRTSASRQRLHVDVRSHFSPQPQLKLAEMNAERPFLN